MTLYHFNLNMLVSLTEIKYFAFVFLRHFEGEIKGNNRLKNKPNIARYEQEYYEAY